MLIFLRFFKRLTCNTDRFLGVCFEYWGDRYLICAANHLLRYLHYNLITMPTPLPGNSYPPRSLWRNAYDKCLAYESVALSTPTPFSQLVGARFLGYMIQLAPTNEGRDNFSNEVVDCADHDALQNLAILYRDHFTRCCKHLYWSTNQYLTKALSHSLGGESRHHYTLSSEFNTVVR